MAARVGQIANHLLQRAEAAATDYRHVAKVLDVRPGQRTYRLLTGMALGFVLGLAILMAAALLPGVFGFTPLVVVSGSMEPTLRTGDIAVTREVEPFSIQLGDVVTYSSISGFITHRVVGIEMSPQGPFFQMKGDANLSADPRAIPSDRIVARVVYRIPKLGFLVSFTDSMFGRIFLLAAPLFALGLIALRRRNSSARRGIGATLGAPVEHLGVFSIGAQSDEDAPAIVLELVVDPSLEPGQIMELYQRLGNTEGVEIVNLQVSRNMGSSIMIAVPRAIPLKHLLEALPDVSEIRDTSTARRVPGKRIRRLKRPKQE